MAHNLNKSVYPLKNEVAEYEKKDNKITIKFFSTFIICDFVYKYCDFVLKSARFLCYIKKEISSAGYFIE